MQMRIALNEQDLKELIAKLDPARVPARLRAGINESLGYLQAEVQKGLPRGATGILRTTVFTELRGRTVEDMRGIVASPQKYAVVVGKGRRAGAKMPPVAALEYWAMRVIGKTGLGYVIARSIARKGIKARPIWENVAKRGESVVKGIVARAFGGLFEGRS